MDQPETSNDDEPVLANYAVTCETGGCENEGISIVVPVAEGGAVVCGPCRQRITNIVPA